MSTTACGVGPNWPFNERNISIEEAQNLAPYDICLPSWLPSGVFSTPTFSYHEDRDTMSGPPQEAIFYVSYSDSEGDTVMEFQELQFGGDPPSIRSSDFYARRLVRWLVGLDQAEDLEPLIVWSSSTFQENGFTYEAVEITSPTEARGSIITWQSESVGYVLYSRLTVTTTLEVAKSVSCYENSGSDETP
jgi:hypothetical protein